VKEEPIVVDDVDNSNSTAEIPKKRRRETKKKLEIDKIRDEAEYERDKVRKKVKEYNGRKNSQRHESSRGSRDSRRDGRPSDSSNRGSRSNNKGSHSWDNQDAPGPSYKEAWGKDDKKDDDKKEKPNYETSGLLNEENTSGVKVTYTEPTDARKPDKRWRLYVFKGDKQQEVLRIHWKSSFLIGKERRVCNIPMHHPSISKQHAVLQFRQKSVQADDGQTKATIKPYIIDLGSTNGTFLNGERLESLRYYELLEKDVLKFAFSSREYVLLHAQTSMKENSPETDDAELTAKLNDHAKSRTKISSISDTPPN